MVDVRSLDPQGEVMAQDRRPGIIHVKGPPTETVEIEKKTQDNMSALKV